MSERWKERERDLDNLERHLEHELKKRGLTRRDLMKGGMAMASALGLGALFAACGGGDGDGGEAATTAAGGGGTTAPAETSGATTGEAAPAFTGTLRVTGLGVDLIDPIKQAGEAALGFKLAFDVTDSVTMVQKAITQPGSFDVFSGYAYQFDQAWPSGNFHNVEIAKITRWSEMTPLMNYGYVNPDTAEGQGCSYGDGDAPFRKLYVDPDQSGTWPSSQETPDELQGIIVQWVDETNGQPIGDEPLYTTGPPADFNMDSMGYNADVIQKEPEDVSWAELFNPEYKGRVALLNDPGIGMQDASLGVRALGLMQFGSTGNMTREEIDALVKILIDRKDQFRAFWTTFDESVNLMASGEVVLESMWSPAVALLVAQGQNVRFAAPPEGFRGWVGNLAISKEAEKDPALLQAAYDYINWWHSGEPGAIMMRQGYYNAVQEPSREFVTPAEWDYWIEGKPAAEDLPGITGQVGDIKKGQVRDGGSFVDRACNFATWNSYFNESEYQVQRWNEFLSA